MRACVRACVRASVRLRGSGWLFVFEGSCVRVLLSVNMAYVYAVVGFVSVYAGVYIFVLMIVAFRSYQRV